MFQKLKTILYSFIFFVFIAGISLLLYKLWSQSEEIQRLRTDLYRIRVLNANTVLTASQKYKFADKKIRFQAKLIAHYKKVIFDFENATQETVLVDTVPRYRVSFSKKKGSTYVFGYTLTNPPFAHVEIEKDPIELDLEVRKEGKDFYTSILFSSDSTLEIKDLKVKYTGFKESRKFFGWCYQIGYESSLIDFDNVELSKFSIGIGIRLGSFIFLPTVRIPENLNFSGYRIGLSVMKF